MKPDEKIKCTIFDISLKLLLKNKDKSKSRTIRNILEILEKTLSRSLSDSEKQLLSEQLPMLMAEKNDETIQQWLHHLFF